jgi:copper(I)-binding protein
MHCTPAPKKSTLQALRSLLTAASLSLACGVVLAQAAIKVESPWARPTVQGQTGGGGFLRIVGGAANDKLLSASADVAGRVELHTMTMDGNIMRMRQVDAIEVPAGKAVDLKPGGLHLMFMDLKAPLTTGSSFALTLRFEKAGAMKVDVKVQPTAPAGLPAAMSEHKREHKH